MLRYEEFHFNQVSIVMNPSEVSNTDVLFSAIPCHFPSHSMFSKIDMPVILTFFIHYSIEKKKKNNKRFFLKGLFNHVKEKFEKIFSRVDGHLFHPRIRQRVYSCSNTKGRLAVRRYTLPSQSYLECVDILSFTIALTLKALSLLSYKIL
ncbi:hypothetical protein BDF20DRAFT_984747 [Mycotypha africana]|uniref:uncharacterized protein n=1 Tax=Mycotypha africana TaxID=64632 RepID=UPI002301B7CB|nr:uncharacterized protein BDF20DRAFT_984747 [Mycotypha africana]KAI8987242.1 hypothetical protein BDF20DRAFT_984747 [Mycotypha africana]